MFADDRDHDRGTRHTGIHDRDPGRRSRRAPAALVGPVRVNFVRPLFKFRGTETQKTPGRRVAVPAWFSSPGRAGDHLSRVSP